MKNIKPYAAPTWYRTIFHIGISIEYVRVGVACDGAKDDTHGDNTREYDTSRR